MEQIMEQQKTTYLSIFRLGKGTLIKFALVGLFLALIVSLIKPLQYRSQASVLVIPNPRTNPDGYQATKSAEKYALTLSSVVSSMSFYNKVVAKNPEIASFFPVDKNKQRGQWIRDFKADVVPETGILHLSTYSRKPEISQNILSSAISVLEEEGPAYLGGYSSVLIYMIDTPIVSSLPVRPNYPLNLLGGLMAGLLVGAVVVFVKAESSSNKLAAELAYFESATQEKEPEEVNQPEKERDETSFFQKENTQEIPDELDLKPIPPINSQAQAPWLTVAHKETDRY